jgi:hypothetical protein
MLGGGVVAYMGISKYLLVQKIRNTPTSKVRSAAAGLVELMGKAKGKKLKSPITKNGCVFWEIVAQYYYQTKNSSGWRTFFTDTSSERFHLDDGTGRMLIEPSEAEVDLKPDFKFEGHLKDRTFFGLIPQKKLDAKVIAYLKENKKAEAAFKSCSGRRFRLYEYIAVPDDKVYVLGTAMPVEGKGSSVAHENLIVKKDKHDKVMLISDSSEKDIVGKMGLTSWASLLLGLFVFCVGLFVFILMLLGVFGG